MTREQIEAQLRNYKTQLEQAKANAIALTGAVQALQLLLDSIDSETKVN